MKIGIRRFDKNKMIPVVGCILLFSCIFVCITGCAQEQDLSKAIVGTWKYSQYFGEKPSATNNPGSNQYAAVPESVYGTRDTIFSFMNNGKGIITVKQDAYEKSHDFTYSITDNILSITGDYTATFEFSIQDKTLSLTPVEYISEGIRFSQKLERQE